MTIQQLRDALSDWLDEADLTDEEVIDLFDSAVTEMGYSDDYIYFMNDFDEVIKDSYHYSPSKLISDIDVDFDLNDEFFRVDETHEKITSFSDLFDLNSPYNKDIIIDAIVESGDNFGFRRIQELLEVRRRYLTEA